MFKILSTWQDRLQDSLLPWKFDPCLGDPRALRLRQRLQAFDFQGATAIFQKCPDTHQQAQWVTASAGFRSRPRWLEAWTKEQPDNFWAWLISGAHHTVWAWEARGTGPSDSVPKNDYRRFFQRLELALQAFAQASRLSPENPLPDSFSIRPQMGLQHAFEEISNSFQLAHKSGKAPFIAYLHMLVASTEKWGQSHEAMFAHAEHHAYETPNMSFLIPAAQIEFSVCGGHIQYLSHPSAKATLIKAFEAFSPPPESVLRIVGGNHFAFAALLANLPELASQAFALCDGCATDIPWRWSLSVFRADFHSLRRRFSRH